mgnify:CR=1 FL=1|tara:strand:+ start:411 stop:1022 length:612 start_codon:yes stop_codon:yes gene_type:complete
MALINRPIYEHFGARHLGVKGPGALTTLEEGVMGVLPLDLSSDPMYWYLQGIRTFAIRVNKAGGGGATMCNVGLSIEDPNELILTRILGIWVNEPYADQEVEIYRCARTAFSSDPGVYGYPTDTRVAEGQPSQTIAISNNNGTATPGQLLCRWRQTTVYDPFTNTVPLIISPTQAIYFHLDAANTRFDVNIVWVEIPAYKAEL